MNPPSEPHSHLEFDLPVPAMPQAQSPLPTSAPPNPRNRWIGLALFGVVFLLVLLGMQRRDDPVEVALAQKVTDVTEALRATKSALTTQEGSDSFALETRNKKRRWIPTNPKKKALGMWKTLADAPNARPSDFRRYALAMSLLDASAKEQILPTLSRAYTFKPPSKPRKAKETSLTKLYSEYTPPIPLRQEQELWEALYGTKPFDRSLSAEYLSRIEALNLGWFASIAKQKLYQRAGRTQEAEAEYRHALASGDFMRSLIGLESSFGLLGFIGLVILLMKGSRLYFRTKQHPILEVLSQKGNDTPLLFGYHPRIFVFVTYLLLPFATLLLNPLLRGMFKGSSAVTLARANSVFYLIESTLTLVFCVWLLRHRSLQDAEKAPPTLKEMFSALGWNAPSGAWAAGFWSYALLIFPLLLITAFSQTLFKHFTTPPHPVILSMALMHTPLDWCILLLQTSVLAPLVEETLFRGILYPALRSRMGVLGGILLSSSIFAILHPTLPAGFLPLFSLGVVLAYLYESRKSLVPSIVLHALNNGFILLLQLSALAN